MGAELSKGFQEIDKEFDESEDEEEEDSEEEYLLPEDSSLHARPLNDPDHNPEDPMEEKRHREENVSKIMKVLASEEKLKRAQKRDEKFVTEEQLFEKVIAKDPDNWREEDLGELWGDAPPGFGSRGWDPDLASEQDRAAIQEERKAGRHPLVAPFYVPYRQPYPIIPENDPDVQDPMDVIEELDRTEEFLTWASYVFKDGSTYEGTVWDDKAHGKGVFVGEEAALIRYEGEWFQNLMEGHGIAEVDIPLRQPLPGSKIEAKMRKKGHVLAADLMSPEDRKWLEMDMEDRLEYRRGNQKQPWYADEELVKAFGHMPERGSYRYAGQWKHGRFHGCGVHYCNDKAVFGRFYFGEFVSEDDGSVGDGITCDEETCTFHAGLAEVVAVKARMFVNKPDGMVREKSGPYNDPQHPYMYEDDDVWMAPGFIHQFYEVPEFWKRHVRAADKEREMWLNAFIKSPLRVPGLPELEYAWQNYEEPEFVLVSADDEPRRDRLPEGVMRILHVPTGRMIRSVADEEHGVRLFWEPPDLEEGDEVDMTGVEFIPLGYDTFFGDGRGEEGITAGVSEKEAGSRQETKEKREETVATAAAEEDIAEDEEEEQNEVGEEEKGGELEEGKGEELEEEEEESEEGGGSSFGSTGFAVLSSSLHQRKPPVKLLGPRGSVSFPRSYSPSPCSLRIVAGKRVVGPKHVPRRSMKRWSPRGASRHCDSIGLLSLHYHHRPILSPST